MYRARVIAALIVLGLGIAVVVVSARQLPYSSEYGPGPGFLPTWIGWVLAACGAVVTIQELRAPRDQGRFFAPRTVLAVKVLVAIAIAFLLVPVVGFSIMSGIVIAATMRIMGSHRWWACASVAALTVMGVHQVFATWLDIPLPGGFVGW